jgi:hypothetical protein
VPDFTWMAQELRLSPTALTVRAQIVPQNDNGQLLWDTMMPRRNVDQTKLSVLNTSNVRVVADRREWNQRGRYIPMFTPSAKELEWVPIESYFKLEEKEINDLMNEVRGNQQIFRNVIGASIPTRVDNLATANYRRLELDTFSAIVNGNIVSNNPETGTTYTATYPFDTGRYETASTPWNDPSVNAYNELLSWYQDQVNQNGPGAGVMLRLATRNAVQADAPNPMAGAIAGLKPTLTQMTQRIQDELGLPFQFFVNERTVNPFTGTGTARSVTKVFPQHKVLFVPAGGQFGTTAFAPVVRAYDLGPDTGEAGIDVRGNTVYYEPANGGRELTIECQFNPMPDPDESLLGVIDAGV